MSAETFNQAINDINLLHYRERIPMTAYQARQEPNEEVERALLIWSLETVRDKVKAATSE